MREIRLESFLGHQVHGRRGASKRIHHKNVELLSLAALDLVIAMPISWLPLVADFSRHGRDGRGALAGTWIGRRIHGRLSAAQVGVLVHALLVASGASLVTRAVAELAEAFGPLPKLQWSQVIAEKRATFACTPGLERPAQATALPGFYLAGDYTAGDYPATLEAAVRSGLACARLAAAHAGSHQEQ
jgi:hypothetical protein